MIRIRPDERYIAEVVILLTTLGAKRAEFNAGKRARDLLEIKRVHHKIVDFNRDARHQGDGEAENRAIQMLMDENKLQTGEDDDLVLPQVFVDGIYIGDADEIQGLEDDSQLDGVLMRKICPNCGGNRTDQSPTGQCGSCWSKFSELMPGHITLEQVLEAWRQEDGE